MNDAQPILNSKKQYSDKQTDGGLIWKTVGMMLFWSPDGTDQEVTFISLAFLTKQCKPNLALHITNA